MCPIQCKFLYPLMINCEPIHWIGVWFVDGIDISTNFESAFFFSTRWLLIDTHSAIAIEKIPNTPNELAFICENTRDDKRLVTFAVLATFNYIHLSINILSVFIWKKPTLLWLIKSMSIFAICVLYKYGMIQW